MLVLASASPRRSALLAQVGYRFRTEVSAYSEPALGLDAGSEVLAHARAKTRDVSARHAGQPTVVLGADTGVVVDGTLLGKPLDADDAGAMLRMLNARAHEVLTGFSVRDCQSAREEEGVVRTVVHFRRLSDEDIERYISTGEPLDKAGGYGIQGRGALLVAGIEGDFFNVVGLPVAAVAATLASFDVHPVDEPPPFPST